PSENDGFRICETGHIPVDKFRFDRIITKFNRILFGIGFLRWFHKLTFCESNPLFRAIFMSLGKYASHVWRVICAAVCRKTGLCALWIPHLSFDPSPCVLAHTQATYGGLSVPPYAERPASVLSRPRSVFKSSAGNLWNCEDTVTGWLLVASSATTLSPYALAISC